MLQAGSDNFLGENKGSIVIRRGIRYRKARIYFLTRHIGRPSMRSKTVCLPIAVFVLLLSGGSLVRGQINRGVIEGIVTDPQGAVVPDVAVTITNLDTNVAVPTKSNSAGYYRVVDLVPGRYKAHFEITGFSSLDLTDVDIPAGKITKVDAQLKIGETRQLVEVTAEVPLVETGASNFSTTLE